MKVVIKNGNTTYYNAAGQVHRDGGLPAYVGATGVQQWVVNGLLHREGGPAYVVPGKVEYYFRNGKKHRIDGPAVVGADGLCRWFINGHKMAGPPPPAPTLRVSKPIRVGKPPARTVGGQSGSYAWAILHSDTLPNTLTVSGDDAWEWMNRQVGDTAAQQRTLTVEPEVVDLVISTIRPLANATIKIEGNAIRITF